MQSEAYYLKWTTLCDLSKYEKAIEYYKKVFEFNSFHSLAIKKKERILKCYLYLCTWNVFNISKVYDQTNKEEIFKRVLLW